MLRHTARCVETIQDAARPPRDMPPPPHAQPLVHRGCPRHSDGSDPENGDVIAPYRGDIDGVVTPGDEKEDEIRFVLQELNSGQTGIVFLEAEGDQTEVNIILMEPDEMS
jgi:hypothetical protein